MALSTATISYDIADLIGTDFETRRTKIWVSTNIADGTVIDTVGNAIRVDTGQGTLAADGTGTVTVWTPGTGSNPDSWQTYVHLDFASPMDRTRKRRTFGPFTVTTSANLADLVEEQEVPAEYLTTITAALQVLVDDAEASEAAAEAAETAAEAAQAAAEAARDDAIDISGIATPDAVIAAAIGLPSSLTHAAWVSEYAGVVLRARDYGVTGNGSTDDTTDFATALSAARAAKARLQLEPNSTVIVSATLDNTGIDLDGQGATVKVKAGITAPVVFQPYGAFTLRNLTIDMNKANNTDPGVDTSGIGIYCYSASGWTGTVAIRDVTIKNGYRAALRLAAGYLTDAASANTGNVLVENLTVDACKYGVAVYYLAGVKIRDCNITNTTLDGILATVCNRLKVTDTDITGAGANGIGTSMCLDFVARGNVIRGSDQHGIAFGGGAATAPLRGVAVGNICEGNTYSGITFDPTIAGSPAAVLPFYGVASGNVCNGNSDHGIYLVNAQHMSVTGNMCSDNTECGIAVSTANTAIDGNHCYGNDYGIAMFGNVSYPNYGAHRIGVNSVGGNTSYGYLVEGASVTDVKWASLTTANPAP